MTLTRSLLLFCALFCTPVFAELKVVASVPDLAALAQEVGGKYVTVKALSLPTQDPHFVDARPSLALELNRADLLLTVGLELEVGWLPVLQTGARNAKILRGQAGYLDCSTFAQLLQIPTTRVDRSQGDIHPGGNPHYLLDPRQALRVAQGIADRLSQLDSAHAADYAANVEKLKQSLEQKRAEWEQRLSSLKGAPVIAYHNSLAYLGNWLGFETIAFLEPKPGIPPNPSHVAEVLMLARAKKVRLLIQESFYPTSASKLVANKAQAAQVILPGGTSFQAGESYLQHMEQVVRLLEQGLQTASKAHHP